MYLANENFPAPSINFLRSKGLKIKSIQEESPGISDSEVILIAQTQNLIILTFDSDYGEIIFRYSSLSPPTVIYFRNKGSDPFFAGNALFSLLQNPNFQVSNSFIVVEKNSIRQRFYSNTN